MQHIAQLPFINHAECSEIIFSKSETNPSDEIAELNNSSFYQSQKLKSDKSFYVRIMIVTILMNLFFIVAAFAQLVTNNNVLINNTSQITVKGSVENKFGTVINNNGTIDVSGDWTNNSGNNGFAMSAGTVILNGANQNISGSSQTVFNNLTLQGSGTKVINQNTTVGGAYASPVGILNVGNVVLDLNSKTLSVSNSLVTAITSGTGYILSEQTNNSSKVKWNIDNVSGAHVVPFGNAAAEKIPLTFNLTSGNAGDVTFSTYVTASDNSPMPTMPTIVTHVRDVAGNDNSANTVDRFWQIDKTGAACNAALTFTYGNSEIAANGNSGMVAQNWNTSNLGWDMPLPGQINPIANTVLVSGVSNFGVWAIAKGASPLPVKLLVYDAKAIGNKKVQNTWATASEINNDYFTVERSKDALHFEEVGFIEGAGTTNVQQNYLFDDFKPYTGISYYRLKQTDYNGEYAYSEIRTVNISSSDEIRVEVFPNPVVDYLTINTSSEEAMQITIVDAKGNLVLKQNSVIQNARINFTNYAPGQYQLLITNTNGEKMESVKIVKH